MLRFVLALLLCATALTAAAEEGCVEVDVAGRREQSLACLSEKLLPPGRAKASPAAVLPTADAIAQRPSNQIGLYNRAATEHRMGNAFGKSVTPQRPPPVQPASPLMQGR